MQKNRFKTSFSRMLVNQVIEFKYYYLFGVLALFVTHKIQSELPFMAKEIADLIGQNEKGISPWHFVLFAIGIVIFRTSSRILFFYPARLLQRHMRSNLLQKLETTQPKRYTQYNAGQLFQYLTGDVDQIRALIGFVGLQGVNFIIAFAILIPKMMGFNKDLIIALTPLFISFLIFTFIVTKNRIYFKLAQEAQADVQNLIIESYIGKKTIKNFHAEESFVELFSKVSLKELYYFWRSSLGISISLPLVTLGIGISMLWGAYIIKSQDLGASSLILFSGFIFLFMEPMGYLSWIGVVVSRSHASWKRLQEFDGLLDKEVIAEKELNDLNENKALETIHTKFWDQTVSFDLKKKAWTVLVAKTGHGKTELLFKMADALRVKGESISLVSQDPYVYNDTVKRNIFLGHEETAEDLEIAKRILKVLGLDFLDENLDNLLELEVGENGKRLSGGQAKRLCLVRSILSGADILIWDDPFSSVDLILEKEIIQKLKQEPLVNEKTIILTSHRLSTVKHSDYIYYLDKDSGIVEEGEVKTILNPENKTYEYFQQQMV